MSSNKLEFEEFTASERLVLEALRGLRYGSVEAVVNHGKHGDRRKPEETT